MIDGLVKKLAVELTTLLWVGGPQSPLFGIKFQADVYGRPVEL